jgi:uncharacterized protein (TIGR03790 family)
MLRVFQSIVALVLLALLAPRAFAAVTQENQVVVLVNSNSPTSIAIGNQYKAIHPGVNIATLNVSTNEEISISDYQTTVLPQVQNYLSTNNLVDSTNYLVTTKGMPLKIQGTGEFTGTFNGSSVDSELTVAGVDLRLGATTFSNTQGAVTNPYAKVQTINPGTDTYTTAYAPRQTFQDYKSQFSNGSVDKAFYLTARLDAYTQADVFAMLNRAQNTANPVGKTYVLDDNATPNTSTMSFDRMEIGLHNSRGAREEIMTHGGNVIYDNTSTHITQATNPAPTPVMGFESWGTNDPPVNSDYAATTGYTLANGAVFSSIESFNANSFSLDINGNPIRRPGGGGDQGLVGDWIKAGGTAATGTVYEPFADRIAHEEMFFPALMEGYQFADAMWMGTEYVSWENVMVGDPLMTWAVPEPGVMAMAFIGCVLLARRPKRA